MVISLADTNLWDKINQQFTNKGGIYKIIAIKDNVPVAINRLLGADNNGILYIGKATSFLDRVIELKKSTDPNYISSNHEFGSRYKKHSEIRSLFPFENISVSLELCDNPAETESAELKKYYETFGELPPLNRRQ